MRRFLPVLILFLCAACVGGTKDHFESQPLAFDQLDGWNQENHVEALRVFTTSCPVLARSPRPRTKGSSIQISKVVWQSICQEALSVPAGNGFAAREFFERRFVPYRVMNNGKDRGLFTGYYEPVLYGSVRKKGDYKYPIYAAPADLQSRRPYYSHAQINRGVLRNRGLELFWVDDPVMLFFMQIQGSGRVRLTDKREVLVGYAGQNGHGYESLGKIMGDEGYLPKDQINFFTLREWLYKHPKEAMVMMERNPSYVFFKQLDRKAPVGSVGVELTAQRSLAVDPSYIPYGLPLFLETDLPGPDGSNVPSRFHRTMIAQDTGGAIRGPVRGDVFFGGGPNAEYLAGFMKGRGVYSLLVPKEIVSQMGDSKK